MWPISGGRWGAEGMTPNLFSLAKAKNSECKFSWPQLPLELRSARNLPWTCRWLPLTCCLLIECSKKALLLDNSDEELPPSPFADTCSELDQGQLRTWMAQVVPCFFRFCSLHQWQVLMSSSMCAIVSGRQHVTRAQARHLTMPWCPLRSFSKTLRHSCFLSRLHQCCCQ